MNPNNPKSLPGAIAGTLDKEPFFNTHPARDLLEGMLLSMSKQYHWQLEAWAVLANHYHFVARGDLQSANLGKFLHDLNYDSARALNHLQGMPGRKVWVQLLGYAFVTSV